jgi:hypothetical protein
LMVIQGAGQKSRYRMSKHRMKWTRHGKRRK